MEDYIFILIAIALSVFSAINQGKKRKAAQAQAQQSRPAPFNPLSDDLFDDFTFNEVIPKPQPSREFHPEQKTSPKQVIKKKEVRPQPSGTDINMPRKSAIIATQMEPGKQKRAKLPIMVGFSLKKAVVYSEILQRKY